MTNTFIDLFAGIGGFRIGFENAGYECVYSCEINEAARSVYFENFGERPARDITTVHPVSIPYFDVLTAGFPCQPFSASGKKLGFNDTRGTLFFDICRIIEAMEPKVFVLENVKHLMYHDKRNTITTILASLGQLGYNVKVRVLNAKDFGVPQNRERVFIVGSRKQMFDFDALRHKPVKKLNAILDNSVSGAIPQDSYTLIESPKVQKSGLIFAGYLNKSVRETGNKNLSRKHRQQNRIYSSDGICQTLSSQETCGRYNIYIPAKNIVRQLSLDECYKVMGFPEDFKKHNVKSECYKQIGNSVSPPLITELALQIKEQLL
jgi:DNA (cytosine-5)-methyltransferase 1